MTTTLNPATPHDAAGGIDQIDRPSWLARQQWPFALRRFEHHRTDGETLDIHYTDEGSGPVLVFVHAGMWSFIWRDTISALRREFRCITMDFPGAGLSSGGRRDIDLSTFPDIVNAVLDHRGIERATFVIHDLGGVVGVLAAAARPERFEGLVTTNSFAWPPNGRALKTMLAIVGSRTVTATLGTARCRAPDDTIQDGCWPTLRPGRQTSILRPVPPTPVRPPLPLRHAIRPPIRRALRSSGIRPRRHRSRPARADRVR